MHLRAYILSERIKKMKVYSSSIKNYYDYKQMPIIKAIQEIIKGGLYEEKENEQKSFKQTLLKNSKTN